VEFSVGNAESLPFMDRLFDTTVTMFGRCSLATEVTV
jgi:ubiquinone/menaquinone biosynthesis C-methylase UbiE